MSYKLLPRDVDIDSGLRANRVLGNAGEEMADNELVDPGLVALKAVRVLDRVDWRMSLVRLLSLPRIRAIPLIENSKLFTDIL